MAEGVGQTGELGVMKRLMILAVIPIGVLTLWGLSDAATTDTAAASVDRTTGQVGETLTFTSTNPCTTACSLTWRRPDIGIARFGGVIVGQGEQITLAFDTPGNHQVVLDMGEELTAPHGSSATPMPSCSSTSPHRHQIRWWRPIPRSRQIPQSRQTRWCRLIPVLRLILWS